MGILKFDDSNVIYKIPQELDIEKHTILDEKTCVYRIVIGKVDPTEEEKKLYAKVFKVIDKRLERGIFLDDFTIEEKDKQIFIILAYITRTKKDFGIFYDIEVGLDSIKFIEKDSNENKETTQGSNNTTKDS